MGVSGLLVLGIGIAKSQRFEIAAGTCFAGTALFGHLAQTNPVYDWPQDAFAFALLGVSVAKLLTIKRRSAPAA
jgi:hypothetical protein